jgi:general secretion pathway protein N
MQLKRRHIIIVLAVYLIALVATIPAQLFTGVINRNLPGVTVTDLEGSIWSGRIGRLYLPQASLEGVEWHLQPLALLLGRLQVGLEYADRQNRIELALARGFTGSTQLRGLEGQVQVDWLQGMTPYTIPVFKGVLQFEDVYLHLDNLVPDDASGTIQWRGAAVDMGQTIALGQLRMALSQADDKVEAVVTETSGLLEGDARFSVTPDGAYRINAKLKPTDKGADLSRHLALVMRRTADGSFVYSHQGRLPRGR